MHVCINKNANVFKKIISCVFVKTLRYMLIVLQKCHDKKMTLNKTEWRKTVDPKTQMLRVNGL